MAPVPLLPLTLLGAVLGLDAVSFPQAMLSRPIVAATLGAAVTGDMTSGLLAGATLELVALETLPVGASRYPEWGSASVVAGALIGAYGETSPGSLSMTLFAAIATAWIGGWTMVQLRGTNAAMARRLRPAINAGNPHAVIGLQFAGLLADLVRGALLTIAALLVFEPLMHAALGVWGANPRYSRAVSVGVAAAVASGAVWKLFRGTAGARWYLLGGLALGLLAMALA